MKLNIGKWVTSINDAMIEYAKIKGYKYFYDLFDGYVGDYDFFEMIADEDLKNNGIDANAIYWAYKIPDDGAMYELDCYNHFDEVTFDDILERLFENYRLIDIL